jgi:hypothetical protein
MNGFCSILCILAYNLCPYFDALLMKGSNHKIASCIPDVSIPKCIEYYMTTLVSYGVSDMMSTT